MQNRDDLDRFFMIIDRAFYSLDNEEFSKYFEKIYGNGKNKIYQKNLSETKKFDKDWIQTVESYFPSIDRITKNPRSSLRYEEDIVAIEKAKKISSASVRHLASHTHFIKTIEDEDVIPKKILTITPETEYAIYENRFIMTLINRLFLFVRNRYLIIKENIESYQKDHVYTESNFEMEDSEVELKIDLSLKKDLDNKNVNIENKELLVRVEKIEKLVEALKGSQFMKMLNGAAAVRPPIMKTNIIMKNPDFKNAYNLWLFLDKYSTLAYDVDVQEKVIDFDPKFDEHIRKLNLVTFATILGDKITRGNLFNIDNGITYTKRSTKQLRSNAEDFVDNPEVIQIEDTTLNEYFLNKYKQLLEESEEEIKLEGKVTDDEALRRALRKTTEIVNGLYNAIFKFEEEKDITNYLITEEDPVKEYEKYKYQVKFAKVVREIKEVDYNQAMRRERKLLKELEKLNKKIIKIRIDEIKTQTNKAKLDELKAEIEKRNIELDEILEQSAIIEDNKILLDHEKASLDILRNELLGEVNKEVEDFKKAFKAESEKEKNELTEQTNTLAKNIKDAKANLALLIKERDKLHRERLEEERKRLKAEALERKRLEKEALERKRRARFNALRELIKRQKGRLYDLRKRTEEVENEIAQEKALLNKDNDSKEEI